MNHDGGNRDLGMSRPISRRDFLNGVALTIGATMLPFEAIAGEDVASEAWKQEPFLGRGITQDDVRYYPPALTGLRGSHPGSFEAAHQLRDGMLWDEATVTDTQEKYDLVIVGGGISGLAAAYFYRRAAGPQAKILILDNHDDFGGHAKRNEFRSGQHFLIGYGGTQSIEETSTYSAEALAMLRDLGVGFKRFEVYYDQKFRESRHLSNAVFFDRETFGTDKLVAGEGQPNWNEFLSKTPLAEAARKDIVRLYEGKEDYFPGLTSAEREAQLKKISYKTFLLDYVKVHTDVIKYFQAKTHGGWGTGIDAVAAWTLAFYQMMPGFSQIKLRETEPEEKYIYHFPDGNASIARLLVRSLVPGSAPGHTMEDIVNARMNYSKLDNASPAVRIRLNSTVVRVKHLGDPAEAKEVSITYVLRGKAYAVRAKGAVLACYNMIIPYLCPEMPDKQKQALHYGIKVPLTYTNVQIRNWQALQNLGVSTVYCPGAYFSEVNMDFPVSIGDYHYTKSPEEPCVIHVVRTPCKPGLSRKGQYRAGRFELFATPFETFERNIRDQFGRMFGGGGFDPARDIEAITVNRWPHGYAYEYSPLWDGELPEAERPYVVGRQRFGRITIANSDAGGYAETQGAIAQGYRAVQEFLAV